MKSRLCLKYGNVKHTVCNLNYPKACKKHIILKGKYIAYMKTLNLSGSFALYLITSDKNVCDKANILNI